MILSFAFRFSRSFEAAFMDAVSESDDFSKDFFYMDDVDDEDRDFFCFITAAFLIPLIYSADVMPFPN